MSVETDKQSFWDHLDVLRGALMKMATVTVIFGIIAFLFKEELFAIVLAPKESDFITYQILFHIGGLFSGNGGHNFSVQLINTLCLTIYTVSIISFCFTCTVC